MQTVRSNNKYRDERFSVEVAEIRGQTKTSGLQENVHTRRADKLPMADSSDLAHTRSDHFAAQFEAHL